VSADLAPGRLRPSGRLRWRNAKGRAFGVLAAGSLLAGVAVVVVLFGATVRESLRLSSLHATASVGLALSLRSMTGSGPAEETSSYVTIAQVDAGSPAALAGIEPGDALIGIEDRPVTTVSEVWEAISELPAHDAIELAWVPNVERLLGELRAVALSDRPGHFRVEVDWVPEGSPGAEAGLREGDRLVSAGPYAISGTRQAWQAVVIAARKLREGPVRLEVERDGGTLGLDLGAASSAVVPLERSLWGALLGFVRRLDEPRYPERAGIASAILGSLYVILVTALVAFPLGVAGAVYLEEYAPSNWLTETLQILIANLAGIPSVVYGIIGLEILARAAGLGRSIVAGGITLGLLILPVMIITSREALRTVPPWIREAAHAVGATRWQVVRHQILPYAFAGMCTGMILSLSRALGEAAPLILLGAFLYVTYLPTSLLDTFTVVPLQIFSWATRPQAGYDTIAAAAILVLLAMLLLLNAAAIYLRHRFQARW
jgi:phosphate transport system permease protein